MSALKERMNLRRKGISGARKEEGKEGGTGDAGGPPSLGKSMTMPSVMPSMAEEDDGGAPAAPISMAGIASALKAAASNRPASDDDDDEWSDDD